ncbi:MAG: BrnT family toxin [Thermodesulfobacteriota bacterium]
MRRAYHQSLPAARILEQDILEHGDTRQDSGERRMIALREIAGGVFVVVYPWRGPYRRIISARRARRVARAYYMGNENNRGYLAERSR